MRIIAFLLLAHAAPLCAQTFDRAAFASDFALLVRTLRDEHPKLQLIRERAAFDSVVRREEAKLPAADKVASYLALVRVVASLEDGHTGFLLGSLAFRRYPIEISVFDDGLFVTRTSDAAARMLAWRLTRIGRVAISDVVMRLRPYLTADNEMGRKQSLPPRIVLHELLEAVGAADARGAWFVGIDRGGRVDSLFLTAPAEGAPDLTRTARDTTTPVPEYLANRARPFWFTIRHDPGIAPIAYAQINTLSREPGFPFAAFVDSLFSTMEREKADQLIIDIRLNPGGDGTLSKALVQRIIRTPGINRRNHLYVVTGRATFSAAVILAAALENETEATFVGEPTGAPANHYGEPARIELPATKLRVSYSKLYWQNGDPRDLRPWIPPAIPAVLTFADWRDNRDPVMETLLAMNGVKLPGRERALPMVRVDGTYATRVAVVADACGGITAEPRPTIVAHQAGSSTVSLTHAGNRYAGSIRGDGTFRTDSATLSINGVTYTIQISGTFSSGGLRALVTVDQRDPARTPCRYTVAWNGTKEGAAPNVIPGR